MKSRYSLLVVFLFVFVAGVLGLIATGAIPWGPVPLATPPADSPDAQVQLVEAQAGAGLGSSTAKQPAASQDGQSILQQYCARCHAVQLLERSKKTRAEWETALTRMEGMGVYLSPTERSVLLDYLAVAEEQ